MLLPVRSIPPTAEHNATLHRTEPSRGKEKPVRLTGAWKSGMGLGGSEYGVYGFVFLDSISCNLVFICFVDAICGHSLHAHYAVLFVSSHFPFRSALPGGRNWLLADLLPHSTITANQIAGMFSWTVNSAFIYEDGKL